jgi:hypothetical protein
MNTIIATVESMAQNYHDHMMEFLPIHGEDQHPAEYAADLETFARTYRMMVSSNNADLLHMFRTTTNEGYTATLLPDDIEQLERWSRNDEDFRVVLFRESGAPVGIINKTDLSW